MGLISQYDMLIEALKEFKRLHEVSKNYELKNYSFDLRKLLNEYRNKQIKKECFNFFLLAREVYPRVVRPNHNSKYYDFYELITSKNNEIIHDQLNWITPVPKKKIAIQEIRTLENIMIDSKDMGFTFCIFEIYRHYVKWYNQDFNNNSLNFI